MTNIVLVTKLNREIFICIDFRDINNSFLIENQKVFHAKLKREYEKKFKPIFFQMVDLVLKENINKIIANDEFKEKFELNWFSPYFVVDEMRIRAYKLSTMDGKEEPKTFNIRHLKHFYV